MKSIFFTLLLMATTFVSQASSPFQCSGKFYTVLAVDNQSVLQELSLSSSEKRMIPLSEPNRQITAIGISVKDMHLYGLDFDTKELLRIDANGVVEALGVPENLNTDLTYWAGDVSAEGSHLVVIAHDRQQQKDTYVFRINLFSPNYYAGITSLISNVPTIITDIATDPVRGVTYCFDKQNRQIAVFGGSSVSHYLHQKINPFIESLFFDRNGQLFGYGSSSEWEHNTLYAINKIGGNAIPVSTATKGSFGDGCSCPYTITFERTITPEQTTSCDELTVNYKIVNYSGTGRSANFEDILPSGFIIESVVDHTFTLATIESAEQTNSFLIPNLDILINENFITIKVKLEAVFEEKYQSQALLYNLPMGLGSNLLSDNPSTSQYQDANTTKILQSKTIQLEDYLSYNCTKDTATLSLPMQNGTFEWSNGSRNPKVQITEADTYWVKAQNECLTLEDTLQINFPAPPFLELGENKKLMQGKLATLHFQSNITNPIIQWSSSNNFDLDCMDCAQPNLTAIYDNTYYLQLTDTSGCTFRDSIQVLVEPTRQLYMPTIFSPNGDGVNDFFFLQSLSNTATVQQFKVIDRWGNLVFSISDVPINTPELGWDGTFKNKPVAAGAYIWVADIMYLDGKVEKRTGSVKVSK